MCSTSATSDSSKGDTGRNPSAAAPDTVLRANAYHLLACAFRPPAEWDAAQCQVFRERFRPLGDAIAALAEKTADAFRVALEDRQTAAVAYTRLFLGPCEILAPPYASLYLDPERRLMGAISQEAAHAYAEANLGPSPGPKEVPDHVTHELEFMYFLAFQEATTGDPDWADRQRRFWNSHLGRWLPKLASAIAEAECHPFYQALAELLRAFSESEATFFSIAEQRER